MRVEYLLYADMLILHVANKKNAEPSIYDENTIAFIVTIYLWVALSCSRFF